MYFTNELAQAYCYLTGLAAKTKKSYLLFSNRHSRISYITKIVTN